MSAAQPDSLCVLTCSSISLLPSDTSSHGSPILLRTPRLENTSGLLGTCLSAIDLGRFKYSSPDCMHVVDHAHVTSGAAINAERRALSAYLQVRQSAK